jgi:hypothetical protein
MSDSGLVVSACLHIYRCLRPVVQPADQPRGGGGADGDCGNVIGGPGVNRLPHHPRR